MSQLKANPNRFELNGKGVSFPDWLKDAGLDYDEMCSLIANQDEDWSIELFMYWHDGIDPLEYKALCTDCPEPQEEANELQATH